MFNIIRMIQPTDRRLSMARFRSIRLLCWLLAGWCLSGPAGAAMKVAFLAPDPAGASTHWDRSVRVMRAAADDLDIELQVAYSKTNTYTNRKQGLALLDDGQQPDFFITGYWSGATDVLLEHAESLGVSTFIVTSAVVPEDRDTVGAPRGKYRQWLGQMTPDEELAGYELAQQLVARARRNQDGDTVHVIGLGGFGDTSADLFRTGGLKSYVESDAEAVLDEMLLAEWSRETAYKSVKDVLSADSPVSVVWSGSDAMALGAAEAARESGKTPGGDIFIGGFDWTEDALKAVSSGDMEATVGGHFFQGAWALVLLHDYHHDRDFADDLGTEFKTPLQTVTSAATQQYLDTVTGADWSKVDFRQFSKVHNPDLETYEWPLDAALEQLR